MATEYVIYMLMTAIGCSLGIVIGTLLTWGIALLIGIYDEHCDKKNGKRSKI